jgi:hypothetical protein
VFCTLISSANWDSEILGKPLPVADHLYYTAVSGEKLPNDSNVPRTWHSFTAVHDSGLFLGVAQCGNRGSRGPSVELGGFEEEEEGYMGVSGRLQGRREAL